MPIGVPSCCLFIVSESKGAIEIVLIFLIFFSLDSSIVLVTKISFIWAFFNLSIAGPESTACVAKTYISFAPCFFSIGTASVIVPAVSIMSSIIITVLFLTSPITCSTFAIPGLGLLLSTIAMGACKTRATCLARAAPPTSGATKTHGISNRRNEKSPSKSYKSASGTNNKSSYVRAGNQ